jgi:hypothetical protein
MRFIVPIVFVVSSSNTNRNLLAFLLTVSGKLQYTQSLVTSEAHNEESKTCYVFVIKRLSKNERSHAWYKDVHITQLSVRLWKFLFLQLDCYKSFHLAIFQYCKFLSISLPSLINGIVDWAFARGLSSNIPYCEVVWPRICKRLRSTGSVPRNRSRQ